MMGEVFRQFEARKLIVGGDTPNDAGNLKIRQMAIGGTAWDVGDGIGDVRDTEWPTRRGEKFDDRLAPGGVALIDSA